MKGHASESWIEERKTMILESKNFNVNTGPIYVIMGVFYFSFDQDTSVNFHSSHQYLQNRYYLRPWG